MVESLLVGQNSKVLQKILYRLNAVYVSFAIYSVDRGGRGWVGTRLTRSTEGLIILDKYDVHKFKSFHTPGT
jgi:hypothetical protein